MRKVTYLYIVVIATIFSCEKDSNNRSASGGTGVGGSLAKFTISGNFLYAVSSHYLYTVDISNPANPVRTNETELNFDMETIYPFKNSLFVGSKTGLYVYSLDTPSKPKLVGEAKHGRSCDPVIANDSVSYSTLKGNSFCGPATSGLYVYDIKNLDQPTLRTTIPINDPIGLGMADSALYVCCSGEGLKMFSIKNPYAPAERKLFTGYHFIDVIPYGDILICWTAEGIVLYDIANRLLPVFIKKIES